MFGDAFVGALVCAILILIMVLWVVLKLSSMPGLWGDKK